MKRLTLSGLLRDSVLVVVSVLWGFPTYLLVINAVTAGSTQTGEPLLVPGPFGLFENVSEAIEGTDLVDTLRNSLIYAVGSGVLAVVVATLAAFAIVAMDVKRPAVWFWFLYSGSLIPLQVFSRPLYHMTVSVDLYDTVLGLVLVHTAFGIPFAMFIVRNVLATMPKEVHEAAILDGANWWRLLRSIYLPFAMPVMAASFIFQFVGAWNELFFGITLSASSDAQPVMATLAALQDPASSVGTGQLLSVALLVSLPTVALYFIFRKTFENALRVT